MAPNIDVVFVIFLVGVLVGYLLKPIYRAIRGYWPLFVLLLWSQVVSAATITVGPAGRDYTNLQTAINAAACGDTLELDEAVEYSAFTFTIPDKDCSPSSLLTITSRVPDIMFPPDGVRIANGDTTYDSQMPVLKSLGANAETVRVAMSGGHVRFRHILFQGVVGASTNALLAIGYGDSNQQFESEEPVEVWVEQCRFVGHPTAGQKRGIELNGNDVTIVDSDFDDFHTVGVDGQCIGGWNAKGNWTIHNNRLECATENFMIGGDDPWVHVHMTATGSPTTTSADVDIFSAGHNLSELQIGDLIAIAVSGGTEYTLITGITGTGDTGTLTFDAIGSTPSVPGWIAWDEAPVNISFKYNLVTKDPGWVDGILDGPTDVSATQVAGSGRSGTHCYSINPYTANGYGGAEIYGKVGNEDCITLSGSGNVSLTFTEHPHAEGITVWRGSAPGVYTHFCNVVSGSPWEDTGDGGCSWGEWPTPPTEGTPVWVKNNFEIKTGGNILVEGNIFENHWAMAAAPNGKVWWLKHANQSGGAPGGGRWGYLRMRNNLVRNVYGWFLLVSQEAYPDPYPPPMKGEVTISNNLVCETSGHWAFTVFRNIGGTFSMEHNTVDHYSSGGAELSEAGSLGGGTDTVNTWNFRSNKGPNHGSFGYRTGTDTGTAAIAVVADTVNFLYNSIADAPNIYPATTLRPNSATWQADFTSYDGTCAGTNWALAGGSDEKNAGHDGADIGVDYAALLAAIDGVEEGDPTADDETPGIPLPFRKRFR